MSAQAAAGTDAPRGAGLYRRGQAAWQAAATMQRLLLLAGDRADVLLGARHGGIPGPAARTPTHGDARATAVVLTHRRVASIEPQQGAGDGVGNP